MHRRPDEGPGDEAKSFVVERVPQPCLQEHARKFFRQSSRDQSCVQAIEEANFPEEALPMRELRCNCEGYAADQQIDEERQIPVACINTQLAWLVAICKEKNQGQDNGEHEGDECKERQPGDAVNRGPVATEPNDQKDRPNITLPRITNTSCVEECLIGNPIAGVGATFTTISVIKQPHQTASK